MQFVGDYQYSTTAILGHGAFAIVYKGCSRLDSDVPVAIKCVAKKKLSKQPDLLKKEIQILKNLSEIRHENIVTLLDCQVTSQDVCLIMEYCNGGDFHDYLHEYHTIDEATIAHFLRQIASAMKVFNTLGIVHRDLKPHNFLLSYTGTKRPKSSDITIKIADFGFARMLTGGVMAHTLCGSPLYMAPEVLMSQQYDARADLWSVAVIVYQCLTGTAPFLASDPQSLQNLYRKTPNLRPRFPVTISESLRNLLTGLLKRNPHERMEFDVFFNHPFISSEPGCSSSPRSACTLNLRASSSTSALLPVAGAQCTMTKPSAVTMPLLSVNPQPGPPVDARQTSRPLSPSLDDFVIVPENPDLTDDDSVMFGPSLPSSVARPSTGPIPGLSYHQSSQPFSSPIRPQVSQVGGSLLPMNSGWQSPPSPVVLPGSSSHQGGTNVHKPILGRTPSSPAVHMHPSTSPVYKNPSSRRSSASSIPSVESMSPPPVHFMIGTPSTSVALYNRRHSATSPISFFGHTGTNQSIDRCHTLPCMDTAAEFPLVDHQPNSSPYQTSPSSAAHGRQSPLNPSRFKHCTSLACISEMGPVNRSQLPTRRPVHQRHCSESGDRTSPPLALHVPHMEGAVTFVVPELSQKTLLNKEHTVLLSKLESALDLANCIVTVAQERSSPLVESLICFHNATSSHHVVPRDQMTFMDETQRRIEQLVLYVRALNLLSSSLNLARRAVQDGRLAPLKLTTEILTKLNTTYHECLSQCKRLTRLHGNSKDMHHAVLPDVTQPIADQLLFFCAIEMCKLGAMDEELGNFEQCIHRYTMAHTLLHGLCQQVHDVNDKAHLVKYKENVERRLQVLGIVHPR